MLLTKSRISVFAGFILFFALALFVVIDRASADNAAGALPTAFGNTANSTSEWNWQGSGNSGKIDIYLGSGLSNVYSIEVFVEPDISTAAQLKNEHKPVHTQKMGNFAAFPTEQILTFNFTSTKVLNKSTPTKVGLHLHDKAGATVLISNAPLDQGNVDYLSTPTPVTVQSAPAPAATPPAVVAVATAVPTPTAAPPATGDVTPGSGLLLAMMLAGLVLIGAGGTFLAQTKQANKHESQ
jgi:hypothetical protein